MSEQEEKEIIFETHKIRLNEEIIKLTCVSITDHQVKQSNAMKLMHTEANIYINNKLQNKLLRKRCNTKN